MKASIHFVSPHISSFCSH